MTTYEDCPLCAEIDSKGGIGLITFHHHIAKLEPIADSCKRCHAPVVTNEEVNLKWYACEHCGYGQVEIDGKQMVTVEPDNKPAIYQ